tara:strand:- start:508 stop:684 length:177 start_codon:yes stop_codon:yes gene_type:complete
MKVTLNPKTVFNSICDMSYEQREELLKMIVNNEPDLADGLLCSLGAKYFQMREARGDA